MVSSGDYINKIGKECEILEGRDNDNCCFQEVRQRGRSKRTMEGKNVRYELFGKKKGRAQGVLEYFWLKSGLIRL